MKRVNYSKTGFEDGKDSYDIRDTIGSIGGDLSCEGRKRRSFASIMRSFDQYQEGYLKGMMAWISEAMQEFSDERQRMLEDEAERVENEMGKVKKTE